jgi:hypothetical protein
MSKRARRQHPAAKASAAHTRASWIRAAMVHGEVTVVVA